MLALFPAIQATHPPMTVVSKNIRLMTPSRLLQDYFNTIFKLFQFNQRQLQGSPQGNLTQSELGTTRLKSCLESF